MIHEFNSENFYASMVDENDNSTDEYIWLQDVFEESLHEITQKIDEVMYKEFDIFIIEGTHGRWNSINETVNIVSSIHFQDFLNKMSDDIKDFSVVFDDKNKVVEYSGYHHDGENSYTIKGLDKNKIYKAELMHIAENLCKDELKEYLLDIRDNCYISNATKDDIYEVICDNAEEL